MLARRLLAERTLLLPAQAADPTFDFKALLQGPAGRVAAA
jgi:hypothetical protein